MEVNERELLPHISLVLAKYSSSRWNPQLGPTDEEWQNVEKDFRDLLAAPGVPFDDIFDKYFSAHDRKLFFYATEPAYIARLQQDNTKKFKEIVKRRFDGRPVYLPAKLTMLYLGMPVEPNMAQVYAKGGPDMQSLNSNQNDLYQVQPPLHFLTAHDQRNWGRDGLRGRVSDQLPVPAGHGKRSGLGGGCSDDEDGGAPAKSTSTRPDLAFGDYGGASYGQDRETAYWKQASVFEDGSNPRLPLTGPPRERLLRTGGPSVPTVTSAVMTPTEQARLQSALFTMRNLKLRRTTACPFGGCQFTCRMDDEEAMAKHSEEAHTTFGCPWCDDRLFQHRSQAGKEEHITQKHSDVIERLARAALPSRPTANEEVLRQSPVPGPTPGLPITTLPRPRRANLDFSIAKEMVSIEPRAASPAKKLVIPTVEVATQTKTSEHRPPKVLKTPLSSRSRQTDWNAKLGPPPQGFRPELNMFCSRCFRKVPQKLTRQVTGDPDLTEQMMLHCDPVRGCRIRNGPGDGDKDGQGLPNRSGWIAETDIKSYTTLKKLKDDFVATHAGYENTIYPAGSKKNWNVWSLDPNNDEFSASWALSFPPRLSSPPSVTTSSSCDKGRSGPRSSAGRPATAGRSRRESDPDWLDDGRRPSQDAEPDPTAVAQEEGAATAGSGHRGRRQNDPLWRDDGRRPSQDDEPDPVAVARDGSALVEAPPKRKRPATGEPDTGFINDGDEDESDDDGNGNGDGGKGRPRKKPKPSPRKKKQPLPKKTAAGANNDRGDAADKQGGNHLLPAAAVVAANAAPPGQDDAVAANTGRKSSPKKGSLKKKAAKAKDVAAKDGE